MASEEGWVSSKYCPADARDAREFLRDTLGDTQAALHQEWLRRHGPAGDAFAAVAREAGTGRLIGQVTNVPVRVRLSGKVRVANLLLDPAIDRAYQGSGVLAALLKDACTLAGGEGVAFTYVLPNQAPYSALVSKSGFENLGSIPLLVRPLNPERLAIKATGSRVLAKTASLARRVWRNPALIARQEALPGLRIEEVGSFDASFASFWDRVQHRFPVALVRDPAHLNWRFAEVPDRKYTTFAATSEGEVRGFTVLRVGPLGQFCAGLMAELLVEPTAEGRVAGRLLIDQACSYFGAQDVDILAGLALRHTDEFRLLRSRGFWVCPKFLEPRPFRLLVRCENEEGSPSRLAYALANWFVTLGDCEAG